jgi:RNA polymerase sigma-70 factor (ECF subfamily)
VTSALVSFLFAADTPFEHTDPVDRKPSRYDADEQTVQRDAELVTRLRGNDLESAQDALRSLMTAYTARLVRFAAGIAESDDVAKDIVQEVFVRLWNDRSRLDPARAIATYCFTATHRKALNVRKHLAVRAKTSVAILHATTPVVISDEDRIDAERVEAAVRAAVAKLPERRRTIIQLRYEEGLSFAAIAEIMEISEQAAKDLAGRSIRALRTFLDM